MQKAPDDGLKQEPIQQPKTDVINKKKRKAKEAEVARGCR